VNPTSLKERRRKSYEKNRASIIARRMREAQKDACLICLEKFSETPNVDHDHATKRVRGLLCGWCNLRLAAIEDIGWRAAAEKYLNEH
jgi:uncharacterized CHY-type Zn-finger protein